GAATRLLANGHHGGLVKDDAAAADINKSVGRSEIDGNVVGEESPESFEHGCTRPNAAYKQLSTLAMEGALGKQGIVISSASRSVFFQMPPPGGARAKHTVTCFPRRA